MYADQNLFLHQVATMFFLESSLEPTSKTPGFIPLPFQPPNISIWFARSVGEGCPPTQAWKPPRKKKNAGNIGSYAALIFLIHDLLLLKSEVFLKGWPSPLIPQTRKFISWRIGVQENKVRIQKAAFMRFFTWFIFVVGVSLFNISSCWEDG